MLTLAEEKANQIEKISTSIDKTVKSVEANAKKAVKKSRTGSCRSAKARNINSGRRSSKKYTEEKN